MRLRKRYASKDINPDEILDHADPGDETQRNFRYQHGYGVILLIAAASKQKPYVAVWCEQFEDFLCKRSDQLFEAYQIKTRKPERGHWALTDDPLRYSIKRFANLVSRFGNKIANLYFVSNANFLDPDTETDRNKLYRSPIKFIEAVQNCENVDDLQDPYNRAFNDLLAYCTCSLSVLFTTLKILHLVVGPGRESFDAEIVDDHLVQMPGCNSLTVTTLDEIRDELLRKVSEASSRRIINPRKHWTGIDETDSQNPILLAKKLSIELVFQTIQDVQRRSALTAFSESAKNQAHDIVFISHDSTSNSNTEFVSWLALRLVSEGYNVWCDLISLKGGDERCGEVQSIISQRAAIFLCILSRQSSPDSNALKELKLAYDVMHSDKREQFIVPLDVEGISPIELNAFLNNITVVDFTSGWAKGFKSLLDRLENVPQNATSTPATATAFWESIFIPQNVVNTKPEEYYSNWFPIDLPDMLYVHKLDPNSLATWSEKENLPYPAFFSGDKLISFATAEEALGLQAHNVKVTNTISLPTQGILNDDFDHSVIQNLNPWTSIIRLLNLTWDQCLNGSGLGIYTLANNSLCYFFHMNCGGDKIFFQNANHQRAWRMLVGYKTFESSIGIKEKRYWHFAIQGKPILHPRPSYIIKSHVMFSDNGVNIWDSKPRLHKARRSWCGDWWNAAWRDRLLASMSFLANGKSTIEIAVSNNIFLDIHITPSKFISPVSYVDPRDNVNDINGDLEIQNIVIDADYVDEYDDEEDVAEWGENE